MLTVKGVSPRMERPYRSLFTDYLVVERGRSYAGEAKFFLDLINSRSKTEITKEDLIINVAIGVTLNFETKDYFPALALIQSMPDAKKYLDHIEGHPDQSENCILLAVSMLPLEKLHSFSFTE